MSARPSPPPMRTEEDDRASDGSSPRTTRTPSKQVEATSEANLIQAITDLGSPSDQGWLDLMSVDRETYGLPRADMGLNEAQREFHPAAFPYHELSELCAGRLPRTPRTLRSRSRSPPRCCEEPTRRLRAARSLPPI